MSEKCKGCGVEVVWITTEKGKKMICEAKPITVITAAGTLVTGWVPHWGNCPYSDQFRNRDAGPGTAL